MKFQLFLFFSTCLSFFHLDRLLELFPRPNVKFSLDTLLEIYLCMFEAGVLVILGLGGVSVYVGEQDGDEGVLIICIRAVKVLVKLVNCYCLGRVLPDFVYKHWTGCLEGKEVTALSEL